MPKLILGEITWHIVCVASYHWNEHQYTSSVNTEVLAPLLRLLGCHLFVYLFVSLIGWFGFLFVRFA